MFKGHISRKFGFVGFKTTDEASKALKHFNNTFIDTSKICVEFAKEQNDTALPRAWSKYTTGSSANKRLMKAQDKDNDRLNK